MTGNPAGARRFKSSHGGPGPRRCRGCSSCGRGVFVVRDSEKRSGSILVFGPQIWGAFLNAAH
ncbi:DUF397 domain-containing protein [Nocardia grenadensis]